MGKPKKSVALKPVSHPTWEMRLTRSELEHLRDLFSVRLPVDLTVTVSQSLASSTGRPSVEALLWNKFVDACGRAGLPLNEAAPDFVVGLLEAPPLGVFQVSQDAVGQTTRSAEEPLRNVFSDEDEKK